MKLTDIDHTINTLVPAMAQGFIIKTGKGEFLLGQHDDSQAGLSKVIAEVREVLQGQRRNYTQPGNKKALAQLHRYLTVMKKSPASTTPKQAAQLRGYVEALFYAEIIDQADFLKYCESIDMAASLAAEAVAASQSAAG